jgi:hypothetical protein
VTAQSKGRQTDDEAGDPAEHAGNGYAEPGAQSPGDLSEHDEVGAETEKRATWLGGVRILDRLEAARFDVFRQRPTLGWADAPAMGWGLLTWKADRRSSPGTTPT